VTLFLNQIITAIELLLSGDVDMEKAFVLLGGSLDA